MTDRKPALRDLDRNALAYALSTHLCYGAVRADSKSIDVLIDRFDSYTPEREQQRQDDLEEAAAESRAAGNG